MSEETKRALDRAIAKEGMKIVFLLRLAVVFPFTWINYACGLTAIPFWRYVAATFVGILPATAAFVFAGTAATNATTSTSSITRTSPWRSSRICCSWGWRLRREEMPKIS